MSKREQVLNALFTRLSVLPDVKVKRNETLPLVVPSAGLLILRDGKQGEPEYVLSPPLCVFHHEAELEILVQAAAATERDKRLDEILENVAKALSQSGALECLVDCVYPKSPEIIEEFIEGAPDIKAAVVPIVLEYTTTNSLL